MGNPKKSVRRTFGLAAAILATTTGTMLDKSWGASWSAINTGLPGIGVGVNSLAIDPTSPSTIYAVTQTSFSGPPSAPGLFKTNDGGGSWRAVSSVAGATALIIDPKNSFTIYAGTDQGVVKSTNGGESWFDAGNGLPNGSVNRLVIDPITTSTLYAVSVNTGPIFTPIPAGPLATISKSTNGGGSWNALDTGLPPNAFITLLAIDPANPSTLYAVATPFGGPSGPPAGRFLKSTDGGQNWMALDVGLPPPIFINSLAIDPVTSSTIYALTNRGLFKTTDGGQSWKPLDTALSPNSSITLLAIAPTTPSIIYAVVFARGPNGPSGGGVGIIKSTDGGDHWNAFNISLPPGTSISSLALDPVTPSRIYAGVFAVPFIVNFISAGAGGGGVFKSTDGGQSWNAASTGLISFDVRTLAMNSADASIIYAGGFGGVFQSMDAGTNWNGTGLSAYTGGLLADSANPNILYAQTGRFSGCNSSESLLLKSTDYGASWSDTFSPLNSGCILNAAFPSVHAAPMVTDPTDPNTLYVGESDDQDGYSALLKSMDGGAHWSVAWDWFQGLRGRVSALAIDPAHPATLYAGLANVGAASPPGQPVPESRGLFKSTDGGATWRNTLLTANAVNLLAIDPSNSNIVYVGAAGPASEQGLFKCTVGGTSMTCCEINKGLAGLIGTRLTTTTALIIDRGKSNILYLGTSNAGVFRSADGGANWSPFNDGLANLQIRALAVAPGSPHIVYAGTSGGVFKILDE